MKGGPGEAKAAVPRPLDHLRVKVIEACKGTDYDARGCIERLSQELGAVLYQNTTKAISHFVIAQQSQVADGDVQVLAQKIHHAQREEQYRVEAENLPVILKKNHRRCKSTVPARVDDVNLDLTAPFFSSTQVLQQADCAVPMARKEGYKSRRHESALDNMPPRHSEPRTFSPATSVSKDDQLSQEHARRLHNDTQHAAQHHSKKNVTFSVERLPSKRRNTAHGHIPHSHTGSPPSIGRPAGLHVDFMLPQNLSPGSAVKARTRNRMPSLDFMVARIAMPLPIIRDEGRALKRNDALFLAAANASRANTPKSEIPVPVVRSVTEDEIAKQSCPSNRPRRRRQNVDPVPVVDRSSSDVPAAKTPGEALAMGVWTEHRQWDHLPEYRPPACVATGGGHRRTLTEREASPRAAATPAGESSSGLVVPDSTYPTGAGAQATLRPPTADLPRSSRPGAVQHDSDASAQENIESPIEDMDAADLDEMGSAGLPVGLFSCLAAMGHSTRNRLSALAAVVADSSDDPGHNHPAPKPIPSAAAGELRESVEACTQAAEMLSLIRKGNVAARELGIIDFVPEMGRSRHSHATSLSAAVRRTRAGSSAPPSVGDRAGQPPTAAAPSKPIQRRGTQLSIEPVLDVHVPRAKRSIRGGSARAHKRQLQDAGDERKGKRLKSCAEEATGACEPAPRVVVHDSADEMESDSDFDIKGTLAVQMPRRHAQAQKGAVQTNGKFPKTPNPKSSRKNGVMCEVNIQTDELPLALRAAGLETSSGNMPPAPQRKRPEKGAVSKATNHSKTAAADKGAQTAEPLCVACSGVPKDVLDRCRRAVSRLGNATMVETEEEAMNSKLTHLVLGSNKRSGKLLLALASSAEVVKPAWLVECIRWRRWVPTTEKTVFEFGSPGDEDCQISQQAHSAVDTLLVRHKVHVASAAVNAKKDCVRLQLFRKLVTLLGGEQASAGSCDVCILVSQEAQKKEQSSAQSSKQKAAGRTQRQQGACKNQVDVQKLGLQSDAVVVSDSWLMKTIETRQKQPYTEHSL